MAFYVMWPNDGEILPPGKIIRFKTLGEARKFMREQRRAFRLYFHDLGDLIDIGQAIDVEDLPPVEPCKCSCEKSDTP